MIQRKNNNDKVKWGILFLSTFIVAFILIISFKQTEEIISDLVESQLSAQTNVILQLNKYKPLRRWRIPNINIRARSVLATYIDDNYENKKILFEKNADEKLGIASLTKLMTAFVALKEYSPDRKIKFSQQDIETEEAIGHFKPGETFLLKDLVYSLLGESSNDAASAISHSLNNNFVLRMNDEAKNLGLKNTFFFNATGLTEDNGQFNYSTANELTKFIIFLLKESKSNKEAKLILKATGTKEFNLFTAKGKFHHKVLNSDKLLYSAKFNIISGKTGWTPLTQGCLIIVIKNPKGKKGFLVNVILGSPDRFGEMEKLINWLQKAYLW